MNRWIAPVCSAMLALLSGSATGRAEAAIDAPHEIKALYRIYKSGLHIGTIEETFTRERDAYRVVSVTQTAGPLRIFLRDRLTVSAEGRIGEHGLEPARYDFKRHNDQSRNIQATFDWSRQRILSIHNSQTESFTLPAGTLDRLSAMYQFVFQPPQGEEVLTWMSQGKQAERYRYVKKGEPTVEIGALRYATVHFARDAKAGESKAQLWLAKDHHYLPVRMLFEDTHGLALEQQLVSLQTR